MYAIYSNGTKVKSQQYFLGSFNWTMAAAMGNRENVIVTDHVDAVRKFVNEFDRLWEEYAP